MSELRLPFYVVNNDNPALPLSQTTDWGLQKLNIRKLHKLGYTGKGVRIGVLDTGIHLTHADLKIKSSKDFTNSGTTTDQVGHGTHVAGIIAAQDNDTGVVGVAPDAEIHNYKVLGGPSGKLTDLANAIKAAAKDGMHIINMSLGSPYDAPYVREACDYAASLGTILVASSGNSGKDQLFYPSSYNSVYAIGAVNKLFEVSSFSTYGDQLEFVAPGEKILSTYLRGGYAVLSGTSMASPFATGCIALLKQMGVKMNYNILTKFIIDIEDPNFDKKSGYGIISPERGLEEPKDEKEKIITELKNINYSVDIIMGMI